MEEELNEDEVEKGGTRGDPAHQSGARTSTPKSTRRHTTSEPSPHSPFQKLTTDPSTPTGQHETKPKLESTSSPEVEVLSIFLTPQPKDQQSNKTAEINERPVYEVDSSDEGDVIEVALPPKPTFTIESSDDDDLQLIQEPSPVKLTNIRSLRKPSPNSDLRSRRCGEFEISASPVPSVVSSVSDDFIRGDCIALNISSRSDQPSFDFGLHFSDLTWSDTPTKKKKKKRNKEKQADHSNTSLNVFATPDNKSKKKRKSDTPKEDLSKKKKQDVSVSVIPSPYVYESDSNQSMPTENVAHETTEDLAASIFRAAHKKIDHIVDLTDDTPEIILPVENIVMANVIGIEPEKPMPNVPQISNPTLKFGSTKVPAILSEDLDFYNLKGVSRVCSRRYSLQALRLEMEKFYNESWGGENFNHREIQKYMSRDKSLWAIDPKDRMPNISAKKKHMCYYCNRPGHRDEHCRMKPIVCHMCGLSGHHEPRCPTKICVNCGSPNNMYSSACSKCTHWANLTCPECGQPGHPYSHCPDLWRRYHYTIDNTTALEECRESKRHHQMYCSGCARRGHLIHTCRYSLPFSSLPINSPYVAFYRPLYPINPIQSKNFNKPLTQDLQEKPGNKRQLKPTQSSEFKQKSDSNKSVEEEKIEEVIQIVSQEVKEVLPEAEKEESSNRDKKGHMIQYNEVSDTSDVVPPIRLYEVKELPNPILKEEIKKPTCKQNVSSSETNTVSLTSKISGLEELQNDLKNWIQPAKETEATKLEDIDKSHNIPKNRHAILRKLGQAFASLHQEIGDPKKMLKELLYLQNHHKQLLKKKIISPVQVTNSRNNVNLMIRKLNMVLLGQAGLAGGSAHMQKLIALQTKLINCNQKNMSKNLRIEIGQHYHIIFAAAPRNDYKDLLKDYYASITPGKVVLKAGKDQTARLVRQKLRPHVEKTVNKLRYFHKRLLKSRTFDAVLKKTKYELLRQLQSHILVLNQGGAHVTPKVIKKVNVIKEQAQLFLANV